MRTNPSVIEGLGSLCRRLARAWPVGCAPARSRSEPSLARRTVTVSALEPFDVQ